MAAAERGVPVRNIPDRPNAVESGPASALASNTPQTGDRVETAETGTSEIVGTRVGDDWAQEALLSSLDGWGEPTLDL